MNRYKPGDKFLLEVTGVNDIGSRTLYEVNGMAGLFSENVLDRLEPVESIVERLEEELKLSDKEKERCVKEKEQSTMLSEHGKYVLQFARNHGITVDEAYEHPTVKAHREASKHLRKCFAFHNGMRF